MLIRATLAVLTMVGAASAQTPDAESGRTLFMTYCVQCHGSDAKGTGPMASALSMAPPDLTGLASRNGGLFPTAAVATQIDGRMPLLAHGGEMPLFGPVFESDQNVALPLPSGQPMMMGLPLADLIVYLQSVQMQ